MYKELSEEELILLAIEYTVKGVPVPSGIVALLGDDTMKLIEESK